ncbi:TonB-dependent receptor [Pseudoxanthomonas helianthi]|uniref:TonB-dependent receptor n=1 Tax=Pseudoxanthomonas helianthi TaxID=1453541 RepID=A0A941ASJ1_9GAMM|nr:TonB-dependent receptor [Pseudoxanthomonas helianthi]MBP3983490.1 TonB-dependent receptor [Pseudoxanthomonas helianthi]
MSKPKHRNRKPGQFVRLPLAAAICLACTTPAFAQEAAPAPTTEQKAATLDTVTVTAQKRTENLQEVPISIQVLGQEKLSELNITNFKDYAKFLPGVSYDTGEGGSSVPYFRGVASGENQNHSGPQPSVGVYVDEQPVTTIGGALDVHIYDIARIEALAGPQGTLYGASSQAGTLRIITNKPDPSGEASGYAVEANSVSHGGTGYAIDAFVNVPLSKNAAIRLVGWKEYDAGYIDNVFGTRTYPSWDADSGGHGTINNAALAKKDFNDVETTGVRAALKIDLNDNWSIMPTLMTQQKNEDGNFAESPDVGKLQTRKFIPEYFDDHWTQAALTVQGKIGNFDLTYAYAHLDRDVDSASDYSDYSFWYDSLYGSGAYFCTNLDLDSFTCAPGTVVDSSQYIIGKDGYTKDSHELRISSPQDRRVRFIAGLFWQNQKHNILQDYKIVGDFSGFEVTGWPDTIWLTQQVRKDHDEAAFGEISFDATDKLTATAGIRFFRYKNSLKGFYGYNDNWSSKYGEARCFSDEKFRGAPCVNLDRTVEKNDHIGRFNLTYKFSDKAMVYATWSEGYRPGGVNRSNDPSNPIALTYLPDTLTNYELGWKTSWADNRLIFNGAVFREDWEDMQFSFIPPGNAGLSVIRNAGSARINGFETDLLWAATYNLRISSGFAWYDAKLTSNYCGTNDDNGNPTTVCDDPQAPKGSQLPVTAKVKGNLTARYTFDVGESEFYLQGAAVYEGERKSALIKSDQEIFGNLPSYSVLDLSAGIRRGNWSLDFYIKNATDEHAEFARYTQCAVCSTTGTLPEFPNGQIYSIANQPRTIGLRFSQEF